MKQLIEDYQRRLDTVVKMQEAFKSNGSINDTKKEERLTTKASEYRTFIAELEREEKEVICLNKEEVTTFMHDVSDCTGAWSDTSYKILKFIGIDPTQGT